MSRSYILPYELFYHKHADPYLQPSQSKYHNLGMNGHIPLGSVYPGKRGGTHGDYGPRQTSWESPVVYPLDIDSKSYIQRSAYQAGAHNPIISKSQPNRRTNM